MSASDPQPPVAIELTEPDFAALLAEHHKYFGRLDDKATVKLLAAAWKLGASDRVAAVDDAVARLTAERDNWHDDYLKACETVARVCNERDDAQVTVAEAALVIVRESRRAESAEAEVTRLREERDEYKALASVGAWYRDCRPNRKKAAEEIKKSQHRIDALAEEVASLRATLAATEELARTLVEACERDFCSPSTEADCIDDESVGAGAEPNGEMAIRFGMIRNLAAALRASSADTETKT